MPTSADSRKTKRIPFFSRITVQGARDLGSCYSVNISRGGLYVRMPETSADGIELGSIWRVGLTLPGRAPLELSGEAVWVDGTAQDPHGRRATAFGLRFQPGQEEPLAEVARFVEEFHYRALAIGADHEAAALEGHFRVERAEDEAAACEALLAGRVDLLVHGEMGTNDAGAARLGRLLEATRAHPQPVICCAAEPGEALERVIAENRGVVFLPLPASGLAVRSLAERLVETQALALEVDALTRELRWAQDRLDKDEALLPPRAAPDRIPGLVGDSPAMRKVYDWVERVASANTTVLVLGESGTGKERVARAIHARSTRVKGPFLAQNCAALAESLLDAELFGQVRGAFTGAVKDRAGLFEAAEGGTLFLDEIGEMSPLLQAKLLRVLQEREVRRLGSNRNVPVDVRVICATHRALSAMVRAGRFRQDLYYRLRAFVIDLPPLRDRRSDVPLLAAHFLERFAKLHDRTLPGFSPDAMAVLENHAWPGNVRELELTVERLVILSDAGNRIEAAAVHEALRDGPGEVARTQGFSSLDEELEALERQRILAELARAGGVVARAARALGMDRTTLSKRCKRLGVPTRAAVAESEG